MGQFQLRPLSVPIHLTTHILTSGLPSTPVPQTTTIYTYEVRALEGGSRVALRCEVKGRGLKRLVAPLVAVAMAKMDGDQLQRLRAAMLGG